MLSTHDRETFLTSTPPTTTTGHGQAETNTNRIGTQDSRMVHFVVCRAETLYEILQNTSYHRQKQGTHRQTCAKFSLGHKKNIMALMQRFLFLSGKQTTRAQVGRNGHLARIEEGTSSERSPRFVARFENSVVHRDWTQIPVFHDTVEGASNETSVSREVYGRGRWEGD